MVTFGGRRRLTSLRGSPSATFKARTIITTYNPDVTALSTSDPLSRAPAPPSWGSLRAAPPTLDGTVQVVKILCHTGLTEPDRASAQLGEQSCRRSPRTRRRGTPKRP